MVCKNDIGFKHIRRTTALCNALPYLQATQETTRFGFFKGALPAKSMLQKHFVGKIVNTNGGMPYGTKPKTLGLRFLKSPPLGGRCQGDDVDRYSHANPLNNVHRMAPRKRPHMRAMSLGENTNTRSGKAKVVCHTSCQRSFWAARGLVCLAANSSLDCA